MSFTFLSFSIILGSSTTIAENLYSAGSQSLHQIETIEFDNSTKCEDIAPVGREFEAKGLCMELSRYPEGAERQYHCAIAPGMAYCWCQKTCGACKEFQCKDSVKANCADLVALKDWDGNGESACEKFHNLRYVCPVSCNMCDKLTCYGKAHVKDAKK